MVETVLITGISGFVGGSLGRRLVADGTVRVVGLSRTPPPPNTCDEFVEQDLARPLPADFQRADAVVHCAALASPWAHPDAYARNNLATLQTMLGYARQVRPRRFVFISSSAVHYAFKDQEGVREDTPWPERPINDYAASKRAGEALVRELETPWTILRPRAVFGPGDTVVFPRILRAAREGTLPRLVRTDGRSPMADLLYIDSLTGYIARTLQSDADGVFLLTNNQPIVIPDFLDEVFDRLGLARPRRRVSVPMALAIGRAMELWSRWVNGWREPSVTRFGVSSLAFTRTFDVSQALGRLGPPAVELRAGLDAFIEWQSERMR